MYIDDWCLKVYLKAEIKMCKKLGEEKDVYAASLLEGVLREVEHAEDKVMEEIRREEEGVYDFEDNEQTRTA